VMSVGAAGPTTEAGAPEADTVVPIEAGAPEAVAVAKPNPELETLLVPSVPQELLPVVAQADWGLGESPPPPQPIKAIEKSVQIVSVLFILRFLSNRLLRQGPRRDTAEPSW